MKCVYEGFLPLDSPCSVTKNTTDTPTPARNPAFPRCSVDVSSLSEGHAGASAALVVVRYLTHVSDSHTYLLYKSIPDNFRSAKLPTKFG